VSEQHTGVQFYRDRYGECLITNCTHPRTKWGLYCINHDDEDDELPKGITLVYSYTIKCIICPYSFSCRGTKEQERVTRLFGVPPCPDCGSMLIIEDDGQIVGRLVKEKAW
jgi:hypothetical protein